MPHVQTLDENNARKQSDKPSKWNTLQNHWPGIFGQSVLLKMVSVLD